MSRNLSPTPTRCARASSRPTRSAPCAKRSLAASTRDRTPRRGRPAARWLTSWLALSALAWALTSQAGAQPITDNDYTLDLYQGPAAGSGRIVGLGGAYTAVAEGINGTLHNPAGFAERGEHEVGWFDWEITGGLWLAGLFVDNDYDNNGTRALAYTDAIQGELGLRMVFGRLGLGTVGLVRTYKLLDPDTREQNSAVTLYTVRSGLAYDFDDWVVGVSVLLGGLDINQFSARVLTQLDGVGAHVGVLYRPQGERYRIGGAFRSALTQCLAACQSSDGADPIMGGDLILPDHVVMPWELRLGFAYQWGERATNVGWKPTAPLKRRLRKEIENGTYEPPPTLWGAPYQQLPDDNPRRALRVAMRNHREYRTRYRHIQPRRYVLLTIDAVLIDRADGGQGLEALLTQQQQASGQRLSVAVHGGIETEVVSDILKLRGGGYVEPSRFESTAYRPHLTLGADVRLFDFFRWPTFGRFTIDLAPRYVNWGFSLGIWR